MPSLAFKPNIFVWKFLSIWPEQNSSMKYKLFMYFYVSIFIVFYVVILPLNFFFMPVKIEIYISEIIFYFTEITMIFKVFLVLIKRKDVMKIFAMLDSEMFSPKEKEHEDIINAHLRLYKWNFIILCVICHIQVLCFSFVPLIFHIIFDQRLKLPISNYYFLTEEFREKHIYYLFLYQCIGVYGHVMYCATVDALVSGVIYFGIAHFKIVNRKAESILVPRKNNKNKLEIERELMENLLDCFKYYSFILKYCEQVQHTLNVTLFVQFGVGSMILCVALYALLLPWPIAFLIFLILYSSVMMGEVFLPGLMGSLLSYENDNLVLSLYKCDWIDRSKEFKTILKMFMMRARKPVVFTGLNMFSLSLATFSSIMNSAYSFFAVLRSTQE